MKSFNVPVQYRSPLITAIKQKRKAADKLKKDFTPTTVQIGSLTMVLARHFGFCYGVENAIEIAFRAVAENPGKRIYLLGEMIHNPGVNADLQSLGVQFLMDTKGNMLVDWNELTAEDIVIIPAFGTTLELEQQLRDKGIDPTHYETTCPFVEKVWNRAEKIAADGYTMVVHGKPAHEETRATFSHSRAHTATVVVNDMAEAQKLARYITGELPAERFYEEFKGQYSGGFDVAKDLQRIGVVNQTTMLASETQAIADFLKEVITAHYPADPAERFADTRDTLCYATNDNQSAIRGMLQHGGADFALIIGGYNSSNTSHLAELCEQQLPTFYIKNEHCLHADGSISYYDMHAHAEKQADTYIVPGRSYTVMVSAGASCPDALVERVMARLADVTGNAAAWETVTAESQLAGA